MGFDSGGGRLKCRRGVERKRSGERGQVEERTEREVGH